MNITATLDEPVLLTSMIEKLAALQQDKVHTDVSVPRQWQAIKPSSIEADVSGMFDMHTIEPEEDTLAFTCSFLFTCVKFENSPFRLKWCASLS